MANNEDVQPIMVKDTVARLDALVRRHGGVPHKVEVADGRPRFPAGRSTKPGPMDVPLFDAGAE